MRNYALDFFRIIFTVIICLHHFQGTINFKVIESGYIGVEFFFILSGFLLYRSYKKNKNDTSIDFTIKKLKRLYPEYVLAFIFCFMLHIIQHNEKLSQYIFVPFSEISLTQNIGIFKGAFNYPLWYLSVLIFGGFLIYELLKRDESLFLKVISPLIIILTFSLLNSLGGGLENWNTVYGLYLPLLRGCAEISIGVILSKFINTRYFNDITKKMNGHKIFTYLIEIISYILLMYLITFKTNYEMYSLFFISILICLANYSNSLTSKLFNNKIFGYFGGITYSMYVNHASIIIIVSFIYRKVLQYRISVYFLIFIYFAILIMYANISKLIVNKLMIKYNNRKIAL